jgi:hypothetical protein
MTDQVQTIAETAAATDGVQEGHVAITVLQLALHRGAEMTEEGGITAGAIEAVGLPFMGGCASCEACIAAFNAAPTRTGYLMCSRTCAGELGFKTIEEAEEWLKEAEEEKQRNIDEMTAEHLQYVEENGDLLTGEE